MKVLITGGAGFVGRHLTKRLLELAWDVTVLDSIVEGTGAVSPSAAWPLFDPRDFNNFHFMKMDCRDFFNTSSNQEFDYIFHLAAVVGGRLTIERNPLAVATDLAIDSDMWNWAKNAKVGKVVNFSSSAAYPINLQKSTADVINLKEDMISFNDVLGMPDLTYGWAKLTCEYLGKIAWERYGIKSVAYRPFSGYGPDQDLTYPFPSICKRAVEMKSKETFTVWGSGLQSRDFIHIDDCVEGILKTMDKIDDGDALNLSTGVGTTFLEFAKIATEKVGYSPKIYGNEVMPTGVNSRIGDITKQNHYGFTKKRSFEDGVTEGVNYMDFQLKNNKP